MHINRLGWVRALILVIVDLINFGGHWFPWWIVPGAADERGRLRRLLAYTYGVASIWVGMAVYTVLVDGMVLTAGIRAVRHALGAARSRAT